MKNAVIVDCCRTPIGRAHPEKGAFRDVRSDDLAVAVVSALIERTGIDPALVEDVVLGNTQQQREQGFNVARTVGLMAGLSVEAGGATVNRLCGSSLQALAQASHAILADAEDVQIVGGLEHMHHIPMDAGIDLNPKLFTRTSKGALMMGITAEFLAQTQGISREEQDRLALSSHQKATAAYTNGASKSNGEAASTGGAFAAELVPVWGRDEAGNRILVERDQCVRPDTSMEALAALPPAFMPGMGTVTAGNSSPLNDGAAALLVGDEAAGAAIGREPLARIAGRGSAGVDPDVFGIAPVEAANRALERAGIGWDDIVVAELNEAFASQTLACLQGWPELDPDKLNVNGGAIAIGHPLGASGARILATLAHELRRRGGGYGVASICIGVGQGLAVVLEA